MWVGLTATKSYFRVLRMQRVGRTTVEIASTPIELEAKNLRISYQLS
jgi:hypothetical protein